MLKIGDSFTRFMRDVDVTRTVESIDGMYVIYSIVYSKPSSARKNLTGQRLSMDTFMDWANKADKTNK